MNSIYTIHPYAHKGQWVFDDPTPPYEKPSLVAAEIEGQKSRVAKTPGLVKEPFIAGADTLISAMLKLQRISGQKGFTLIFSGNPFPGVQFTFDRQEAELGGYWYKSREFTAEGWLCPALFCYFEVAPEVLYVQVKKADLQEPQQKSKRNKKKKK